MSFGVPRIFRALATNLLACLAPEIYVRLTHQTGRGDSDSETPADIARYFRQCVDDYLLQLCIPQDQWGGFLEQKTILEYGPGDLPGVGMLLVAMGARRVYCVDRFPLVQVNQKGIDVVRCLDRMLTEDQRKRFQECFLDFNAPHRGFNPERISYVVNREGLSGMTSEADMVISRAVLEHVHNLEATFTDMACAMPPGAIALHLVDLKSHGLHRATPLDFLEYPQWLWSLMYSHKGVPNRWRANHYKAIVSRLPFERSEFRPTARYASEQVDAVLGTLAEPFRRLPAEELAWQGFWLELRKRG